MEEPQVVTLASILEVREESKELATRLLDTIEHPQRESQVKDRDQSLVKRASHLHELTNIQTNLNLYRH